MIHTECDLEAIGSEPRPVVHLQARVAHQGAYGLVRDLVRESSYGVVRAQVEPPFRRGSAAAFPFDFTNRTRGGLPVSARDEDALPLARELEGALKADPRVPKGNSVW